MTTHDEEEFHPTTLSKPRAMYPPAVKDRNAWAGLEGRDRPALDMDGWRRALDRRQAARACRSANKYTRSLGLGSNLE